MKWEYFEPKFEYEEIFKDHNWPWAGHKYFAYDLIRNLKPKTVVELGTHKGSSFFSFCQAVKDAELDTELFAVDTWKGDEHASFYDESIYLGVKNVKDDFYSNLDINLVRKTFNEAVSNFGEKKIDILHIDGLHTYEAVKHDFDNWIDKVSDNGIILLHDTHEKKNDFGVYQLWDELRKKYNTMEFSHSHGLGIVFKNKKTYDNLSSLQEIWKIYYDNYSKSKIFKYNLDIEKENNSKLQELLKEREREIRSIKREVSRSNQLITESDHNYNAKDDHKSKKNEIVIYTAIFGDKDDLYEPKLKLNGIDLVCFTDNKNLRSKSFEIRIVSPIHTDPTRNARMYKILSHKFLPEYKYSIWVDGNVAINADEKHIKKMIDSHLKDHDIAMFIHPDRACLYKEATACIELNKDDPKIINRQMAKYKEWGYPEKNGMIMSTVVFRRNLSPCIVKLNDEWWNELARFSRRDQLSFNYIAWKNKLKYKAIPGNIYNDKHFTRVKHKIKESVLNYDELVDIKGKKLEEIKKELVLLKSSKFWKARNIYMKIKKIPGFLLSLPTRSYRTARRDGFLSLFKYTYRKVCRFIKGT